MLLRELRYAIRQLCRTPGFAGLAILVMALGIGANVALFTVVRSVLMKPLPFKDPNKLVELYEHSNDGEFAFNTVAGGVYAEWRKQNRSFTDLALLGEEEFNLAGAGDQLPEKLRGSDCTWNLLSTLGVRPALGRDFTAADDQQSAAATVLLSWSLWQRRFGGDPGILNNSIYLNGHSYTVIGILPSGFAFPDAATQLWAPVYYDKPVSWTAALDNHVFQVVGRLRPGFSEEQGKADLSVISRRLHDQHPEDAFISSSAATRPLLEHMVGDVRKPLYVLLAATFCV